MASRSTLEKPSRLSRLNMGFTRPKRKEPPKMKELKQEIETDDHVIPLEKLIKKLGTNMEQGLTSNEAKRRLIINGPNTLTPPKKTPNWIKFLKHMTGGFSLLIWAGSMLCFISYSIDRDEDILYLGITLVFIVFFTGIFSYVQEAKSEAIMESFKKLVPQIARVIRDGQLQEIPPEDLVVGDVVEVNRGDQIPADIRIFEADHCKVENSSLTGESKSVKRDPNQSSPIYIQSPNMIFFSTSCVEGKARGICIRCGDDTLMGKIATLTSSLGDKMSPLSVEIDHFVKLVTVIAFVASTFFFILSLIIGLRFIEAVTFFIALLIACVPEGLLATVTVCLTLTARRMAKKNCLVKHLVSVETLGSTTTICSDKTGTLTQNRMTVNHLWIKNQIFLSQELFGLYQNIPEERCELEKISDIQRIILICTLCSNAVFKPSQENVPIQKREILGDASESAILKYCQQILDKTSVTDIRDRFPRVFQIPFDSSTRMHVSVHRVPNDPGSNFWLCVKGAPENIISKCNLWIDDGVINRIDKKFKEKFNRAYTQLGGLGERVIGLAYMTLPKDQFPEYFDFEENSHFLPPANLIFAGLISMMDPAKPGVRDSVQKCQNAGIKVVMVTGDHPVTAEAIAKSVNILSKGTKITHIESAGDLKGLDGIKKEKGKKHGVVLTGEQVKELGEKGLAKVLSVFDEIVFARTSPQQKLTIVEAFQSRGEVVAVTGDGVNDSPALKRADIGVAMGISGSDVSKQAAAMILLDDNFSSIVTGVEEGRTIFDNLKKSIAFSLTSNTPELVPFLLFMLAGIPLPLGVITILCIDLGTDILPGISLAYEPPESDLMERKPRTASDKLVTSRLLTMAYFQIGVIQTLAGFLSYFCVMGENGFSMKKLFFLRRKWLARSHDVTDSFGQEWSYGQRRTLEYYCQSVFFVSIVITQWFDLIICKTRRNSIFQQGMRNEVLNFSLIFGTGLTIFFVYCPGMSVFLKVFPLRSEHWLFGIPFGIFIFCYDEFRRFLIRRYPGGFVEQETYY